MEGKTEYSYILIFIISGYNDVVTQTVTLKTFKQKFFFLLFKLFQEEILDINLTN